MLKKVHSKQQKTKNKKKEGTSLVVQWLRLHAPKAGSPGSIPQAALCGWVGGGGGRSVHSFIPLFIHWPS